MKKARNPENIHQPPIYSHQIEVSGNERWLAISGQVGQKEDNSIPEDVMEQFEVALENIKRNLEAANMGVQDLVKMTFFFVELGDNAKRREILENWIGDHRPCMTLIQVVALANPTFKVEVEAWASSNT